MRIDQEKFQTRIGLNTGSVIRKGKDIFGEVVNVASRMQSKAPPGDILLTDATYQEIKEYVRCTQLGDIEVKGIKDFITAYSPQEVIADTTKLMDGGKDEPGPEAEGIDLRPELPDPFRQSGRRAASRPY